ncbi:hypothetical protein ACFSTD_03920 [Novosphingobium colocasiae]|uniref:Uncharacterized protein n=1 Tax=Novosphingobium colocasiae TaxID=1256513 RepID=A0A918PDC7_9SPHN|nr:hypothetical protein [Novosphingobium colocasiae]GGZ00645.1 hypothetical protein GCM10011614_14630 [Novosphingobium colocasiae]
MRVDAKALLDRLGKSDFTYREFADRFSELELWPLFEALLRDTRLAQLEEGAEPGHGIVAGAVAASAGAPGREPAHQPFAALFSRYEGDGGAGSGSAARAAEPEPTPHELPPQDVRMLLRQLSELQRKGEL